jgi:hypothetical protein
MPQIYFQTNRSSDDILACLNARLNLEIHPVALALCGPDYDIYLMGNDDYNETVDPVQSREAYRAFRCMADVAMGDDLDEATEVHVLKTLLEWFWSKGIPAVAESLYDDELPHRGGHEPGARPWAAAK